MALKKSTIVAEEKPKKSKKDKLGMLPIEERKHTKDFIAEPPKAGLKAYEKIKAAKAKIVELQAEYQEMLQNVQTPFGRDQDSGFSFFDDEGTFTTLLPRQGKWFIRGELHYKNGRPGRKPAAKPAEKAVKKAKAAPAKAKKAVSKKKKSKAAAEEE